MELYIDIATPEELEEQFGYPPSPEEISEERESCARYPDYNFQRLTYLFAARGESRRALECLEKIKSPFMLADTGRMLAHNPQYFALIR